MLLIDSPSYTISNQKRGRRRRRKGKYQINNRPPNLPLAPYKHGVRLTLDVVPRAHAEVVHRADHVLVPHKEAPPHHAKQHRSKERAHKPLHSLFRRETNERGAPEDLAPDVGEYVVADDEGRGDEEPDEALEDVVHDKVARDDDEEEGHVDPAEETELLLEVALFQGHDEAHEADGVEGEADDAVVGGEEMELGVSEDDVLVKMVSDANRKKREKHTLK